MDKVLSVIIPMYNVERYIEKCIESILDQSINMEDYEIIIVDDGSSDSSYSIAEKYKKKFPDLINLYKRKNSGQASARNFGFKKATGKYISFIDSDDYIHYDMFRMMINEAEYNNLDIVQCNYINFFDNSNDDYPYKFDIDKTKIYNGREYFEYNPSLSPCDKIYLKKFLTDINFEFTEGRFAEDVLEISKVIFFAHRIKFIDHNFYFYRRNSYNSTRNSISIEKCTKLAVDKIYISHQLNNFCKINNWSGLVNIIILRNIIGAFFKKEILDSRFRKPLFEEFKSRQGINLILENMTWEATYHLFLIGYKKIVLKKDS